jgi:anti-sigma factor RsiW
MACAEALRTQAYFDGELSAGEAAEVERHLETCADCAALLGDLDGARRLIREQAPYARADDALRRRIAEVLDQEAGPPPRARRRLAGGGRFLAGAASGSLATALAASLALLVAAPPPSSLLVRDLMNAHLRSMMSDHLVDVVSSDRHTVKPWFAAHADVSPPAVDFADQGYRLVGGRTDYVDGRRAAVVVYRHGAHVINVFAWAGGDGKAPATASRDGYRARFWKQGGLNFAAVSDTGGGELDTLVQLIRSAGS